MHCNRLPGLGEQMGALLTGNLKNSEYDVPLPKPSDSEATILVQLSCPNPNSSLNRNFTAAEPPSHQSLRKKPETKSFLIKLKKRMAFI